VKSRNRSAASSLYCPGLHRNNRNACETPIAARSNVFPAHGSAAWLGARFLAEEREISFIYFSEISSRANVDFSKISLSRWHT
jgi:hypothetical protein